ncbi:hypothetical protein PCIT_a1073 [Pseudoalteromonas citrea]|uniref:Tyr recombinase domain-containing protein n=1 Tax=Pseudoalteromonas citrea TaxID=43655 RepID=A0AAD4ALM7_9GAMM|nr:integrase family protein [Pseudoalteromonas citrea]KAF7774995.1 hypothetical protein PCIT_a1073 [Pseudoalteromonas citrea]
MPSEIKFSLRTKDYAQAIIAANAFSELLLRFDKQFKSKDLKEIQQVVLVTKKVVRTVLNGTNVNQILANMPVEDFDVEALSMCEENTEMVTLETAAPPTLRLDAEQQFTEFLQGSEIIFDVNGKPFQAAVSKIVRRKQFIGSLAQARHNSDYQKENQLITDAGKFVDFGIADKSYIKHQEEIIVPTLEQLRKIYLLEEYGIDMTRWEIDQKYRNAKENDRAKKLNESIKEAIFFLGDRPATLCKSRDFDRMFKSMLSAPKARARHYSSLTLEEIESIDWSRSKIKDNKGKESFKNLQLCPSTVDKHRQRVRQFFTWIIKRFNDEDETFDLIRVNPVQTKAIKKGHRSKSWAAFDEEDLYHIFTHENVIHPKYSWQFWIPILSRATGARPNEIAQLSNIDVCQDTITLEGDSLPTTIHYLTIDDALAGQSTKNEASRRHVPLAPILIKLGFIDYVDKIRRTSKKGDSLWPSLTPENGYYTPAYSKWFTRKVLNDANVIKNRFDEDNCKKVTYSFRATFITSFTEQKLNKSLLQQIVGHLDQDKERMTNHYTKKFARGVIYKELREYKMPDINYLLQLKHKANKTA